MTRKKKGSTVQIAHGAAGSFGVDFRDVIKSAEGCKKGNAAYWESDEYNRRLYLMFRAQILELALSRFKWLNLPDTCDERYLELTLTLQGQASIAYPRDKKGIWYTTQLAWVGRPNVYDNPTAWRAIGNNGFRFDASWNNGVVVWDNRLRYPTLSKIDIWANELVDIIRTEQVNRMHQKIPFVFEVPQEMVQQAENVYKQVAGGEPAIIGTNGLEAFKPNLWLTGVQYIGEELEATYRNKWNEIYSCLGIANQIVKTERMIESEVRTQHEPSEIARLDYLSCRREAAERLNTRFGDLLKAPIMVVWNRDNLSDVIDYAVNPIVRGDDDNDGSI